MGRRTDPKITVEHGELRIVIGLDALKTAVNASDEDVGFRIRDIDAFAPEMALAMEREGEDGDTEFYRFLVKMADLAAEETDVGLVLAKVE